MSRRATVTEPMFIRLSREDKAWLQKRGDALRLRPAIYARMLLSQAIEFDRLEPGRMLCEDARSGAMPEAAR